MRRIWIYIIAAMLVIVAIAGILIARENSSDHTDKTGKSAAADRSPTFPKRQACIIFKLADAKQVLGDNAKGGSNPIYDGPQGNLDVSSCNYTQDSGSNAPVTSSKSASLLVRAPKTAAGITSNQNQFGPLKPADSQQVSGYGDNAYWDPQLGQLNILKNNTWYILSNGPITPSARTLDQAKTLADILINRM
jgi:hypothetical protein